jgi:hypothetical protein
MFGFPPAFWVVVILAYAFPSAVWASTAEAPGFQTNAEYSIEGMPAHTVKFAPPAFWTEFAVENLLTVIQTDQ